MLEIINVSLVTKLRSDTKQPQLKMVLLPGNFKPNYGQVSLNANALNLFLFLVGLGILQSCSTGSCDWLRTRTSLFDWFYSCGTEKLKHTGREWSHWLECFLNTFPAGSFKALGFVNSALSCYTNTPVYRRIHKAKGSWLHGLVCFLWNAKTPIACIGREWNRWLARPPPLPRTPFQRRASKPLALWITLLRLQYTLLTCCVVTSHWRTQGFASPTSVSSYFFYSFSCSFLGGKLAKIIGLYSHLCGTPEKSWICHCKLIKTQGQASLPN